MRTNNTDYGNKMQSDAFYLIMILMMAIIRKVIRWKSIHWSKISRLKIMRMINQSVLNIMTRIFMPCFMNQSWSLWIWMMLPKRLVNMKKTMICDWLLNIQSQKDYSENMFVIVTMIVHSSADLAHLNVNILKSSRKDAICVEQSSWMSWCNN
jgi:hypothetical protein